MFCNRLFEARKKKGLTQIKTAELANIRQARYSAYETGRQIPPVDVAATLADVLDVSLDWLCGKDKQSKFESVGDIAQTIVDMTAACEVNFDEVGLDVAIIIGHQQELADFLARFDSLREMENKETTKKVFSAWVNTEIQELSAIPLLKR